MIDGDQMTVTSKAHDIPQLYERIEDNRFWLLLVFVRNESDVLVESYGSAKTDNVPLQY